MRTYNNSIVIKFDTTATGNAGAGKPVTVYEVGTVTKAELFNSAEQAITNPINADNEGNYSFKVANGIYDIVIDQGLPTQVKIENELITDAAGGGSGSSAIETIQLTSGQVLVQFTVNTEGASFYINGTGADNGRILESVNYSYNQSLNQVTLTNSYPSGTYISAIRDTGYINEDYVRYFDELSDAVSSTKLAIGDQVSLKERTAGNGGGGMWEAVLASTVTPNTFNIVQCVGVPTLAFVLQVDGVVNINCFGASQNASPVQNQGAIQAAINAKSIIYGLNEVYIHDSQFTGKSNIIIDGEQGFTLQCKSGFGDENQIDFNECDNIKIRNVIFDMRNDINTPVFSDDNKENSIHLFSCKNTEISRCTFTRTLSRGIRYNATSTTETENAFIHHNNFTSGSKGGCTVRRYGQNVHIYKNILFNSVDSSKGGAANEKPIEVSGTIGVHIHQNKVTQTNGDGGSIVVEYIDRQSEKVNIWGNECKGQGGGNGIKVGASVDIRIYSNDVSSAGASGIYLEGCVDARAYSNDVMLSGNNSIIITSDGDTGRVPEFNYAYNNNLSEANQNNNDLGAPISDGSSANSYHVRVSGGGNHNYIHDNTLRDASATANGISINSDHAYVWDNDLSPLAGGTPSSVIAFNNRFMSPAQTYRVWDNTGFNTKDSGSAEITSGSNSVTITPNIPPNSVSGAGVIDASLRSAMSGSALYHSISNGANADFNIQIRDSSHALTNSSSTITFQWTRDIEKVLDGAFAGTN